MNGKLILIVEDNQKNFKLFRDLLAMDGHNAVHAQNGEEGVKCCRDIHPDLVLMDIPMPVKR